MIHRFGAVEVDEAQREIRFEGESRHVEPQVFDVLSYLIANNERVVPKEELLDEVWGDRFVSESALTSRIKAARQAVGDSGRAQSVIRTAHGRGYQFVAPLAVAASATAPAAPVAVVERAPDSRLVGRGIERHRILGLLDDSAVHGVVLTGAAGMGKSELARDVTAQALSDGWSIARVHGHESASDVPLACLAHHLPPDVLEIADLDGDMARGVLMMRARQALQDSAGPRRLMLLVDDVDRVDSLSLTIIGSLIEDGSIFALMTQRTQAASIVAYDHLVRSGIVQRFEVGPMSLVELERMLGRLLEGPITPTVPPHIAEAVDGNPGMLVELVTASLGKGVLRRAGGVWTLTGPLATGADLAALVDARLAELDEDHRGAAALLALAGALEVDLGIELMGEELIDGLELQGMVSLRHEGGREVVRLSHPLFGEVLRESLTPLRARRLKTRLAEALEAQPTISAADRARIVRLRLDVGGAVEAEMMVEAATLALLDRDMLTTTELVKRLEVEAPSARVAQLRAELLFAGGRFVEAGHVLEGVDLDELDTLAAAFAVRRIATAKFYGEWNQQDALAQLSDNWDRFEGEARDTLQGYWVMLAALDARYTREAKRLGEELLAHVTDFVRLEVLCGLGMCGFVLGELGVALEAIDEFKQLVSKLPPSLTWAGPDYAQFVEIHVRTELGDLSGARGVIDDAVARVGRSSMGFLPISGARCLLRAGEFEDAIAWLEPLIELAELIQLITNARPMQATAARAALGLGDVERAKREAAVLEETLAGTDTFVELDLIETIARVELHTGRREAAAERLRAAAEAARVVDNPIMEASLLGALVEAGGAVDALDRLTELSELVEGELIGLKVAHARALAEDGELEGVAARYEELGFVGTAAMVRSQA